MKIKRKDDPNVEAREEVARSRKMFTAFWDQCVRRERMRKTFFSRFNKGSEKNLFLFFTG